MNQVTPDPDLTRFHSAQSAGSPSCHNRALTELRSGRKRSHWIWFVLPQLAGLGRSANAQRYSIADLAEARAYLADPVLLAIVGRSLAVSATALRNRSGTAWYTTSTAGRKMQRKTTEVKTMKADPGVRRPGPPSMGGE